MDENPYDILGVSRDASPDEVKRAYRKKARENHPDLNPDDPGAADRMNRINEAYDRIINPEKYAKEDARKAAARGYGSPYRPGQQPGGYGGPQQPGSSGGNPYGNPYGNPFAGQGQQGGAYEWTEINWEDIFGGAGVGSAASTTIHPEPSAADSAEVRHAIEYINANSFQSALGILQNIPSTGRNARWYYLFAVASHGAGNTVAAVDNIRRARQLDPGNADYRRAEQSFTRRATAYAQEGQQRGFTMGGIDPTLCCCWGMLLCSPACGGPLVCCI